MSGYIGKSPGASTENRTDFVATAGQTVFVFGYTPGYLDVFINGTIQKIGVDYNATSGTSFTTVLALAAGDEVFASASFANAPINAYTKVENDLLLSTKALLAGSATQAFAASTAAVGTDTTQVATTAYATALGLTKALLAGSSTQAFSASTFTGALNGNANTATNLGSFGPGGLTEVGRYFDFHGGTGAATDWDVRLDCGPGTGVNNGGTLTISAAGGVTASTFTGALSGNASTASSAATATLATKASTLSQNGGNGTAMTFNWSGQSGQPSWLWGSNDGTTTNVYNPSNFNVNSAATLTNSPGSAPHYACRAWVNFNGVPATVAIRASGNVSSITDNGVGDYTVNFTTAMPDANYSFQVSGMRAVASGPQQIGGLAVNTTSASVYSGTDSTALADWEFLYCSVFR